MRSKDSVVMKFERCEHMDDTSIVDGDQEGVKCYLCFVLKDQVRKVPSLGDGWSYMAVLVVWEFETFVEYWRNSDFGNVSVE